ncbi:MAG: YCF48-related protein [Bacteroidota bacterium]
MKKLSFILALFFNVLLSLYSNVINAQDTRKCHINCIQTNENTLYVGTNKGLYSTSDNGKNWISLNDDLPENIIVTGISKISEIMLISTSKGIYKSINKGLNWQLANKGINSKVPTYFANHKNYFVGINYDGNVYQSKDTANSWSQIFSGIGYSYNNMWSIVNFENSFLIGTNMGIYISDDNGINWSKNYKGLTKDDYVQALMVNGKEIFAGTGGEGVFVSADNGKKWTKFNKGLPSKSYVKSLVLIEDNILAGTNEGVYITNKTNADWKLTGTGIEKNEWLLTISLTNNNIYAYTQSYNIFYSSINPIQWVDITASLDKAVDETAAKQLAIALEKKRIQDLERAEKQRIKNQKDAEAKLLAEKANQEKKEIRKQNLLNLLSDAQNEFVVNQGNLKKEDENSKTKYYETKINLDCNEAIIQCFEEKYSSNKMLIVAYTYTKNLVLAGEYLQLFLDEINSRVKSGKYKGNDSKNKNGDNVTELFDLEGNAVMKLISNQQYITLTIFSKGIEKPNKNKLIVKKYPAIIGDISSIDFSKNSKYITATSYKSFEMYGMNLIGGSTLVYDTLMNKVLLTKDEGATTSIFDNESKKVITSTVVNGLKSYNLSDTASLVYPLINKENKRLSWRLVYTTDNKKMLIGSMGGEVKIFDVITQKLEKTIIVGSDSSFVLSMNLINNDKELITHSAGKIRYWDLANGKELRTLETRNGSKVFCSALSADKKTLITSDEKELLIWDAEKAEIKGSVITGPKYCCAVSPNGSIIAVGVNGNIFTFDGTGKFIRGWSANVEVRALAFSPDGKYLASGYQDGFVNLYLSSQISTAESE